MCIKLALKKEFQRTFAFLNRVPHVSVDFSLFDLNDTRVIPKIGLKRCANRKIAYNQLLVYVSPLLFKTPSRENHIES